MKKKLALAFCTAALAALVIGAAFFAKQGESVPIEHAGTAQNAPEKQVSLSYQGKEYPMRKHLQTVLLIGTDSQESYEEREDILPDYYNYNQADFLMLLALDTDAETVQILQINRDTMTDVPWLDVLGNYGGTEYKQLCLAFNYGDGGAKSCKNTVNAVSALLFDAPIQSYIQVPMSVIPLLNDLVGGVPVTFTEDMTAVDPVFIQGTTLRLNGTQAEKFVRARMELADDTNISRMKRQRDYLESFRKQAREAIQSDPQFGMRLVEKLENDLQSNLTAQQLMDLIEQLDTYRVSPIQYADGELILGQQYYEFYVDEGALWEIVREAYCA